MEEIISEEILKKLKEYRKIINYAIENHDHNQLFQLKLALITTNDYIPSLKKELKKELNEGNRHFFEHELEIWVEKKKALSIAIKIIENYLQKT
jgi:hypothetical protein